MDGRGGARRAVRMYVRNEIRYVDGSACVRGSVDLCGWVWVGVGGCEWAHQLANRNHRTYVRLRNLFKEVRRAYMRSHFIFSYMGVGVGVGGCWWKCEPHASHYQPQALMHPTYCALHHT